MSFSLLGGIRENIHVFNFYKMVSKYFLLFMVLISSVACTSEELELEKAEITAFEIKGVGKFDLDKAVTFAAHSDSTYYLRILTQPADGPVYVSVNEGSFRYQASKWLKIDPSVSTVRVSAGEQAKTITFAYGRTDLLMDTKLYPNPVSDSVAFAFSAKSAGLVHTKLYNLEGIALLNFSRIKQADEYYQKESLRMLPDGIYLMRVQHGDSHSVKRIMKTR